MLVGCCGAVSYAHDFYLFWLGRVHATPSRFFLYSIYEADVKLLKIKNDRYLYHQAKRLDFEF